MRAIYRDVEEQMERSGNRVVCSAYVIKRPTHNNSYLPFLYSGIVLGIHIIKRVGARQVLLQVTKTHLVVHTEATRWCTQLQGL